MNRFWIAMAVYAVIAVLAWRTIDDEKIRYVTWLILAMFAVRTYVWDRKKQQESKRDADDSSK